MSLGNADAEILVVAVGLLGAGIKDDKAVDDLQPLFDTATPARR